MPPRPRPWSNRRHAGGANHALEAMSPELALLDEAAYPPDEPRETEYEEERRKGLLRNLGQNLDPSNSGGPSW